VYERVYKSDESRGEHRENREREREKSCGHTERMDREREKEREKSFFMAPLSNLAMALSSYIETHA
jgi:hypothetical protein